MRRTSLSLLSLTWLPMIVATCDGPTQPADDASVQPASFAVFPHASWGNASSVDPGGLLGVNTAVAEGCPHESPNGRSLFFASNRAGQLDIWVSTRSENGNWGTPERLPAPLNTANNEFCPTPLPGGGLLFVSTRNDGLNCSGGTSDLYESHPLPSGGWAEPDHLGCAVNSVANEFSPSYVPAGGGQLYFSSNRSGVFRLYVSDRADDGSWTVPTEVAGLNVDGYDTSRPNVSVDGRVIVFDSNRPGGFGGFDIWYAHRQNVGDAWSDPVNAGGGVNTGAGESRATLSRNGRRLYFGSTRAGFEGASDLFVAQRN